MEEPIGELAHSDLMRRFMEVKPRAAKKCQACRWQRICWNGCPHYRSLGDGKFLDLDYLCPGYMKFYDYAVPILAEAVRRQRGR